MKAFVFLLLAYFCSYCHAEGSVPEILQRWGVSLPLPQIDSLQPEAPEIVTANGLESETVVAQSSDGHQIAVFVRTLGVSGNLSLLLIQSRRRSIFDFYAKKNRDRIKLETKGCRPTIVSSKTQQGSILISLADEKRKVGVCVEKKAKYRVLAAWLNCARNNSVVELNYFMPVKDSTEKALAALE